MKSKTRKMYSGSLLDIAMTHSENLILNAQQGDREAFNKLVTLWYKRVYNYAYKYFSDHDMSMEVTQRAFIAMHRKISSLRSTDKFRPWLYKIVTNFCHEEERKLKRARERSATDEEGRAQMDETREFNPDRKYAQSELAEILLEALNEISPEQKEVVIMKEYEGLKFSEIAEVLEISENTAKSRMYYGLSALKQIMTRKNINKETISYEL